MFNLLSRNTKFITIKKKNNLKLNVLKYNKKIYYFKIFEYFFLK